MKGLRVKLSIRSVINGKVPTPTQINCLHQPSRNLNSRQYVINESRKYAGDLSTFNESSFTLEQRSKDAGTTITNIENALYDCSQIKTSYFLTQVLALHKKGSFLSTGLYCRIATVVIKRREVDKLEKFLHSLIEVVLNYPSQKSGDINLLQNEVIFHSISELIRYNQQNDGLRIWSMMDNTGAFTTTPRILHELIRTLSSSPNYIPQLAFHSKLHFIMKSDARNESIEYYTYMLGFITRYFCTHGLHDLNSCQAGLEALQQYSTEAFALPQLTKSTMKSTSSPDNTKLLKLLIRNLECHFSAYRAIKRTGLMQSQSCPTIDGSVIQFAFKHVLEFISNCDHQIDINTIFLTHESNTGRSYSQNNENISYSTVFISALKTLCTHSEHDIAIDLIQQILEILKSKNFRTKDPQLFISGMQPYFSGMIRAARFPLETTFQNVPGNIGSSTIQTAAGNKDDSTMNTNDSLLKSSTLSSSMSFLVWSAFRRPSSNEDMDITSSSSTKNSVSTLETLSHYKVKKQNIPLLNKFAFKLIHIMKTNSIPLHSDYFAEWIHSFAPNDQSAISKYLPKSSSYVSYYSLSQYNDSQEIVPSQSTTATSDNLTSNDTNTLSNWNDLYLESTRIFNYLDQYEDDTIKSRIQNDPKILEAQIILLTLMEIPSALKYALRLVEEWVESSPTPLTVNIYTHILASSIKCNSFVEHEKLLIWIESTMHLQYTKFTNSNIKNDPNYLYSLFFAYARANHGFKSLKLLQKIRRLNLPVQRSMYKWCLTSLIYGQPMNKYDWDILMNTGQLCYDLLLMMNQDHVVLDTSILCYLLQVFGKASLVSREDLGSSMEISTSSIIQQMHSFLYHVCMFTNDSLSSSSSSYHHNSSRIGYSSMNSVTRIPINTEILRNIIRVYCQANEPLAAKEILENSILTITLDNSSENATENVTKELSSQPITAQIQVRLDATCFEPLIYHYTLSHDLNAAENLIMYMLTQGLQPTNTILYYLASSYLIQNQAIDGLDFIQEFTQQHSIKPHPDIILDYLVYSLKRNDAYEANRIVTFIRNTYTILERENSIFISRTPRISDNIRKQMLNDITNKKQHSSPTPTAEGTSTSSSSSSNTNISARLSSTRDDTNEYEYESSILTSPWIKSISKSQSTSESNLHYVLNKPGITYGALSERELQNLYMKHKVEFNI